MAELAVNHFGLAPPEVKQRAKTRGSLAVDISPDESFCHGHLAYFLGYLREFEAAEQAAVRAFELNPCNADALFAVAHVMAIRGRAAECVEWIARAKEIDPLWPAHYDTTLSGALYDLGRYEEAARVLSRLPRLSARQEMRLAATYARLGQHELARRHAAEARVLEPDADFVAMARAGWVSEHDRELESMTEGIGMALRLLDGG
jgi:adenylate cyclase